MHIKMARLRNEPAPRWLRVLAMLRDKGGFSWVA
jgi:hypothetical protein